MAERPKPEGFPWLMPYLPVADVARAIDFYERAFGFRRANVLRGPDGEKWHAAMTYRDVRILVGIESRGGGELGQHELGRTPNTLGGSSLVLYLFHEDVDALYKQAIEAGAVDGTPPEDAFWGDRVCLLFDPDGHAWNFATHKSPYLEGE
jgi:PhnB protein